MCVCVCVCVCVSKETRTSVGQEIERCNSGGHWHKDTEVAHRLTDFALVLHVIG